MLPNQEEENSSRIITTDNPDQISITIQQDPQRHKVTCMRKEMNETVQSAKAKENSLGCMDIK